MVKLLLNFLRKIDLKFSSSDEKWAYEQLQIGKDVSTSARKIPFVPT
jgi:hypothetical protein